MHLSIKSVYSLARLFEFELCLDFWEGYFAHNEYTII